MCPEAGSVARDEEIPPVPTTDHKPDADKYAKIDADSARHVEPNHPAGDSNTQANSNPYAPRYSDFLSNVQNFKIIESTLRGEPSNFDFRLMSHVLTYLLQRANNSQMPSCAYFNPYARRCKLTEWCTATRKLRSKSLLPFPTLV